MGNKYRNRLKRYDIMSDIVSGLVNYRIIHSKRKDDHNLLQWKYSVDFI